MTIRTGKSHIRAFTLIELLVVISIIGVLMAVALPLLSRARTTARKATNATHLRSIHQSMVAWAGQSGGLKLRFPGVMMDGPEAGYNFANVGGDQGNTSPSATEYGWQDRSSASTRMAFLLNTDMLNPDYLISPAETNPDAAPGQQGEVLTQDNCSYAVLELVGASTAGDPEGDEARREEWRGTGNARAVVMGDRNMNLAPSVPANRDPDLIYSYWTGEGNPGQWEGSLVFNDNAVTYANEPWVKSTQYGDNMASELETGGFGDYIFTRRTSAYNDGGDCILVQAD